MATRTKKAKGSRTRKIGLAMATLATAGAVSMFNTKTRRMQLATTAAKVGKAAATLIATSEVLKEGRSLAQPQAALARGDLARPLKDPR